MSIQLCLSGPRRSGRSTIGLRSITVIVVPPPMAFEYLSDPETVVVPVPLPSRARITASDPGRRLVVELDHGVHESVWTFAALSADETELTVDFRVHSSGRPAGQLLGGVAAPVVWQALRRAQVALKDRIETLYYEPADPAGADRRKA
ncbi:SRPBCC family protein [Rhodococcus sp. NPDC056960]|uniref:SRPBCC family protein n=1 Tax=Rhodococcus sp. NPDC056960 TaxID=3345982 RepID=UPI00363CB1AE